MLRIAVEVIQQRRSLIYKEVLVVGHDITAEQLDRFWLNSITEILTQNWRRSCLCVCPSVNAIWYSHLKCSAEKKNPVQRIFTYSYRYSFDLQPYESTVTRTLLETTIERFMCLYDTVRS